jgi:hypothetical protein
MLRRIVLLVAACAFTGQALAALFDDEEARRRIELLRQSLEAQNRTIDERLARIELLAGDKNALLEFASQMEQLRNDVAGMRAASVRTMTRSMVLSSPASFSRIGRKLRSVIMTRSSA